MHVPSAVHSQLFIFIIYDVSHIPYLLEDGMNSYKWSIQQLLRDCTYNANLMENNEKLRYLFTKIKIKTWCSQNYIFIFKSYVECCIFLSIYELQLHEKKCIFIFHGSFCSLRFMELNFFWVWNDNSSLVNCLPKRLLLSELLKF